MAAPVQAAAASSSKAFQTTVRQAGSKIMYPGSRVRTGTGM
jgi:hypothetical protein